MMFRAYGSREIVAPLRSRTMGAGPCACAVAPFRSAPATMNNKQTCPPISAAFLAHAAGLIIFAVLLDVYTCPPISNQPPRTHSAVSAIFQHTVLRSIRVGFGGDLPSSRSRGSEVSEPQGWPRYP